MGDFNKNLYLEMPMGYDDIHNLVSFWCTGNQTVNKISKKREIAFPFYARRFSIERNSYGNVSGWLGGWLSVTLRYCIKTA